MKRAFDLVFSLIVLILFLPFGIIISILILLSSPGGVFYRQERIGKNGIPFTMEMTFSRSSSLKESFILPHPLDMPCDPTNEDIILVFK